MASWTTSTGKLNHDFAPLLSHPASFRAAPLTQRSQTLKLESQMFAGVKNATGCRWHTERLEYKNVNLQSIDHWLPKSSEAEILEGLRLTCLMCFSVIWNN